MIYSRAARFLLVGSIALALASCGRIGSGIGSGDSFGGGSLGGGNRATADQLPTQDQLQAQRRVREERSTIWDLFENRDNPNTTVEVNRYIWTAALDILNFLPIEKVDPFTGVIVTGYGVPPGGGRAYRATVYVQDPALDARSLKLALESRGGGAVAPDTVRAIEDAILTRARQLRIRDSRL
jgi:hypothetical protein